MDTNPENDTTQAASGTSRRTFLQTLTVGAAGASLMGVPAASYARILGANDRIGIGIIGAGRMGRGHIGKVHRHADTDIVALCDVYKPNLDFVAAQDPDARTYTDHAALLADERVDAVMVASPDHWHAIHAIDACKAGKDVYVEKPTSVAIAEGRAMVEAARKYDRVMQVGTQQRSGDQFARAVEIVRSGRLGPISFVRCWNVGNNAPEGIGAPPDSDPPPGLDWDRWLGPAAARPFNINRFGVVLNEQGNYQRWASFRWFWDYAGGMMTDWGVHLLDIVQWAMDVDYPNTVAATGGKFALMDNRETPDTIQATYGYPGFICTYENRVCNSHRLHGQGYGILFYGTQGTLYVNRGFLEVIPEEGRGLEPQRYERTNNSGDTHFANFIDCMRSRQRPTCDIEIGHRSSSTAILGNMAYRTGRSLVWDGESESVIGDAAADAMVRRAYRAPWSL